MPKSKLVNEDTRKEQWAIILNPDHNNMAGFDIKKYFETLKATYHYVAMIEHNEDIISKEDYEKNKESYEMQGLNCGDIKPKHIHICLMTHRTRKGTLTDNLAELLRLPRNCISVDIIEKSWRGANRYLLHLDNEDKTNYMPFDVYTSHEDYFKSFLVDRITMISEEQLIEIVKESKTTSKILIKIGSENYRKYSRIINDLIKEFTWN